MRVMLGAVALLLPVVSGCIADSSANQATNVQYTVESSGVEVGISNPQFQVIKSDSQFSALVSVATMSGTIPTVDFSANELVAVYLGENVGCGTDTLSINGVTSADSTVTVIASRKTTPPVNGGPCNLLPLNGFSYVLLTIPKTTKPVSLSFE